MLPVAELPFAPERQILGEIELKIVRQQRRERGPDHDMQHEHDREASAGLAPREIDQGGEPRRRRKVRHAGFSVVRGNENSLNCVAAA